MFYGFLLGLWKCFILFHTALGCNCCKPSDNGHMISMSLSLTFLFSQKDYRYGLHIIWELLTSTGRSEQPRPTHGSFFWRAAIDLCGIPEHLDPKRAGTKQETWLNLLGLKSLPVKITSKTTYVNMTTLASSVQVDVSVSDSILMNMM